MLDKLNPQMSSLASEPFPDAGKHLLGPSFEEKVKKRNETVKILSKAAPRKANMQFFQRGTSSQFKPGRGGQFPGRWPNHQPGFPTRGRSSYFRGRGRGRGNPRLLNQVRTIFHPKVSSSSRNPVKYRYVTSKRELTLSKSKVFFKQFRPLFCRGRPLAHSRSITILRQKLAGSYKRPLGIFSHFRVPYSLYNHTTPGFSSLSQSVCRGRPFDRQRIRRANSKAGNPSGFRKLLQCSICQQPVCDLQNGRQTKTSLQPLPLETIYKIQTFQNRRHAYAERPTETKRFQDQFQRCLLYSSNLERPSKGFFGRVLSGSSHASHLEQQVPLRSLP